MAYNPNFAPWQGFTSGGTAGVVPTFGGLGRSPDQDLLGQSYDAQQSLLALTKAARLKHLTDLNMALRRMGQAPGGDGTYAVASAERGGYPGIPGLPANTGFGVPAPPGLYPGQPVPWTPPLSAAQQMANMRPLTAASASPVPRYNPDGSLPAGGIPVVNPRSAYLNSLLKQISDDQAQSFRNSLYTPIEPYLSPFDKQLALAQARGGSERPPSSVNVGSNANALAQAAARGTTPTANATLTDNRVRSNNDTKLAEQLIYNGGITSQADLQDQFPDADWNRLGALLNAVNQGNQRTYDTAQSTADYYNQALDKKRQDLADAQAQKTYDKTSLPWYGFGRDAAKQARNDTYNESVLAPDVSLSPSDVPGLSAGESRQIQYDPESQTFVPIVKAPTPDTQPTGYINRQDMPGQNFHTDLPRSKFYNGLPVVRTQADYDSLPAGAQAVTGQGRVLPPKGGYRGGPFYGQGRGGASAQGGDEFGQDFADAGLSADPVVNTMADWSRLPRGAYFIDPNGVRRQKR